MEPTLIFMVFVPLTLLAILLAYLSHKKEQERIAAIIEFASQNGFDYHPGADQYKPLFGGLFGGSDGEQLNIIDQFEGFTPFGEGHSPRVENVLTKVEGDFNWVAFDYIYKVTSHNGKSTQTTVHRHGIVAAQVPITLPWLTMAEETFFHRIGSKLGMREVTFESEEFNRAYFVQCDDERAAYDLLHPQTLEFLLHHPVRHWQMGGFFIVLANSGVHEPADLYRTLEEIRGFYELIPDYVRQDRGLASNLESPHG